MLRLAIVGLGGWGCRLVDSVQGKASGVRFTTAVVRNPETASAFAESRNLKVTSSLDEALADPTIDGVVSCGPAQLHAAHALRALEAGKPVLAVKPLAFTHEEAQSLARAAERRGLLLALGYNRCFFPNVMELRNRLRSGDLGELLHAEGDFCVDRYRRVKAGNWKAERQNLPAGSLLDHVLYLVVETLGRIAETQAFANRSFADNDLPHTTAVLLRTIEKRTAVMTAIGVTSDFFRFQLFGSKGWIELRDECNFTFQPIVGAREDLVLQAFDPQRREIETFAAAVRKEIEFPVAISAAVHSVAALEAIARSADEERLVKVAQ